MTQNQMKLHNQTKWKLAVDLGILLGFLIAMDPHSTGITIHEWLSTSMIAALVVHLLLNWDWIVQVTRRFFSAVNLQSRINYVLNWLLFIDGSLIMLSGFMISEALLPSLGITLPQGFVWRRLHDMSANLFLFILGLHTALHWGWIVDAVRRYILRPVGRLFSIKSQKDIPA